MSTPFRSAAATTRSASSRLRASGFSTRIGFRGRSLEQRLGVLVLARRDDDRVHLGVSDHVEVVAGRELGADSPAERAGPLGILVGDGEEAHRGVAGGHVGAEGPDPAGADDRDADLPGWVMPGGYATPATRDRRDHRECTPYIGFPKTNHALLAATSRSSPRSGARRDEQSAPSGTAVPVAASITDSVRTGGVSGTMSPALRVVSVPRL